MRRVKLDNILRDAEREGEGTQVPRGRDPASAHLGVLQKRETATVLWGCCAKPVPRNGRLSSPSWGPLLLCGPSVSPYSRANPLTSLAAVLPLTKWHKRRHPPSRGLEAGSGGQATRWLPLDVSWTLHAHSVQE